MKKRDRTHIRKATPDDLAGAGFTQARKGLWLRDENSFREKLRAVDLAASDMDECMIPLISQAAASAGVFKRMYAEKDFPGRREHLARMRRHGARFAAFKLRALAVKRPNNALLIREFEGFAEGIPIEWFSRVAEPIAMKILPGAAETLAWFKGRGVTTGVVSLGFEPVLRAICDGMAGNGGPALDFVDCSPVETDTEGCFLRFVPGGICLNSKDKAALVARRIEVTGAAMPLVIGHDQDDLEMLREARKRGGMAVGIAPLSPLLPHLDAAVIGKDWTPLAAFLGL